MSMIIGDHISNENEIIVSGNFQNEVFVNTGLVGGSGADSAEDKSIERNEKREKLFNSNSKSNIKVDEKCEKCEKCEKYKQDKKYKKI